MRHEKKKEAVKWAYFLPLGSRSHDGGPAFEPDMWGSVPGGYRNTINDNLVLIVMIETLEGLKNADEIAKVPGVHAVFAASGDLSNFTGNNQGDPDYERAINIVHDAAIKTGKKSCGPLAWRDRPDFTCFQAEHEQAAIARGARSWVISRIRRANRKWGRLLRPRRNKARRKGRKAFACYWKN